MLPNKPEILAQRGMVASTLTQYSALYGNTLGSIFLACWVVVH